MNVKIIKGSFQGLSGKVIDKDRIWKIKGRPYGGIGYLLIEVFGSHKVCVHRSKTTPVGALEQIDNKYNSLIDYINKRLLWECSNCGKNCDEDPKDYYMLKDEVWSKIASEDEARMLCMSCAESRLGRKLEADDIKVCPLTKEQNPYTARILTNNK